MYKVKIDFTFDIVDNKKSCFAINPNYDRNKFKDGNIIEVDNLRGLSELLEEAKNIEYLHESSWRWIDAILDIDVDEDCFIISIYENYTD